MMACIVALHVDLLQGVGQTCMEDAGDSMLKVTCWYTLYHSITTV